MEPSGVSLWAGPGHQAPHSPLWISVVSSCLPPAFLPCLSSLHPCHSGMQAPQQAGTSVIMLVGAKETPVAGPQGRRPVGLAGHPAH